LQQQQDTGRQQHAAGAVGHLCLLFSHLPSPPSPPTPTPPTPQPSPPSSELFDYTRCITYAVLTSVIALDRPTLKEKVVDSPEVLAVVGAVPHLAPFLQSLYECKYDGFFKVG
jgi:hypothetical protein